MSPLAAPPVQTCSPSPCHVPFQLRSRTALLTLTLPCPLQLRSRTALLTLTLPWPLQLRHPR